MKYYVNNSYKQMHACLGGQAAMDFPEKIYLDITQDCNLYCGMCRDGLEVTGKTMSFDLYCRLVDETAPYVKSYSLFNWGEPLMVKDFRERVLYINEKKRHDCVVDISTNGMLLSGDMIEFLREQDIVVTVSFDAADKATFERIRGGSNFRRVCDNLRALSKAFSRVPINRAPGIYTTVQKDNQRQLTEIAKLASSLGARRMGFGLLTAPRAFCPTVDPLLLAEIENLAAYLDAEAMLNDLYPTRVGDYLWWGSQFIHKDSFLVDDTCNAPLVSASIAYNGDVFLCCNVGAQAGNVAAKSFREVWLSEKYNELRQAVNDRNSMPGPCKVCAWFNRRS
mgnify:FL=1